MFYATDDELLKNSDWSSWQVSDWSQYQQHAHTPIWETLQWLTSYPDSPPFHITLYFLAGSLRKYSSGGDTFMHNAELKLA